VGMVFADSATYGKFSFIIIHPPSVESVLYLL
jgi:hypothetical protein